MRVTLYALCEPDTGVVRYVGYSQDPKRRFARHCKDILPKTHKTSWVRSLLTRGLKPVLRILAVLDGFDAAIHAEIACIAAFKRRGDDLTNGTRGGDGLVGAREEVRARIAAKLRGRKAPLHEREKISAALTGREFSDEHRANLSAAARGRVMSIGAREKMSNAWVKRRQRPVSEGTRAKISASLRGRAVSPETRKKIGEANRKCYV